MKTVKNQTEIKRVSNETAEKLVESGKYHYCQKSEWKSLKNQSKKEK